MTPEIFSPHPVASEHSSRMTAALTHRERRRNFPQIEGKAMGNVCDPDEGRQRSVILGWGGRGLLSFTEKPTQVSERRSRDELHPMSPFPSKGRVKMSVFILK